jgi:hypothetical protein
VRCKTGNALKHLSLLFPIEPIAQLAAKGSARDSHQFRRLAIVAMSGIERLENRALFEVDNYCDGLTANHSD